MGSGMGDMQGPPEGSERQVTCAELGSQWHMSFGFNAFNYIDRTIFIPLRK